ncbi:MAG: CoA-binding protein, partial [Alphaproteobacteria bacterium]|nr:CoA-binding protein [Alphaproteobacteria bacterium]
MPDLSALLWPNAVAIVGASAETTTLRGRIMEVMLRHDFEGPVYPISRSHEEIQGLRCYPSIDKAPERVDLAILIIPAQFVPDALAACGEAGVRAAQIL